MAGKSKKATDPPLAPTIPTDTSTPTASPSPWPSLPTRSVGSTPVLPTPVTPVASTLHPQALTFVPPSSLPPLSSMPPLAATITVSPSIVSSSVPSSSPPLVPSSSVPPLSSMPPLASPSMVPSSPADTSLLYSPSVGISPSSLHISPQTSTDSVLRELRSYMAYCTDRFRSQEMHMVSLSRLYEDLVSRLNSIIVQQSTELQALRSSDTNKDILIRTLSEEISQLRTQVEEHSQSLDTRLREVSVSVPVPITEIQEKIATIQSDVQRHSEWVEVARKKPPVHPATVSETLAESDRRAQRSLNLRIRGIEKSDTASSLQQAQDFVTQTMGITDHGIVSAYRAGTDISRHQPLIVRFRDAETRLAVLRRRSRLRESPQIHLDEDLTPLQWQDYRALLPQRHAARQEGLWAVIRDGRLITRPLRSTQPASTPTG